MNRCKACWLKICLEKFVLDDETKEVIDSHYTPRLQKLDLMSNLSESSRFNDRNSLQTLPPLPLLNTRKRKNNDDALIEKYNQHKDLSSKFELTQLKNSSKRKNKDLSDEQAKSDKRERKRKLIYSPPSTPRRPKKHFKLDPYETSDDFNLIQRSNESIGQPQQNKKLERSFSGAGACSSLFLDNSDRLTNNLNSNSSSLNIKLHSSATITACSNRQSTETCSLGSCSELNKDSSNQSECGNCSYCLENEKNLLIVKDNKNYTATATTTTTKLNQRLSLDELSEDYIVDNCSELSYELSTNKVDDDYLKDTFYDCAFSSTKSTATNDELGLKYIKNFEKKQATTKKEAATTKFKNANKKSKKRKDLLTNNNLTMRKSLLKKNSFSYIFDADSSVIYEVLNANSPFL